MSDVIIIAITGIVFITTYWLVLALYTMYEQRAWNITARAAKLYNDMIDRKVIYNDPSFQNMIEKLSFEDRMLLVSVCTLVNRMRRKLNLKHGILSGHEQVYLTNVYGPFIPVLVLYNKFKFRGMKKDIKNLNKERL